MADIEIESSELILNHSEMVNILLLYIYPNYCPREHKVSLLLYARRVYDLHYKFNKSCFKQVASC
jgi:hypothetical protein